MINADFDLTLLRTFVAVVDAGSLTRASETIHRSQAAVSMQVQRLESAVGTPLFIRNGRRLVLTRAGCTLLEYARRLLDLRTEAWRSEEHTSELQSLMRISYAVFCLKKKKHKTTQQT